MTNVISESGMDFISKNAFRIEESQLYRELGEEIKSIELVRIKKGALIFLEARSSFPDPKSSTPDNLERFNSQSEDVCDKFIHSLNLFSSIKVNVSSCDFPEDFILPDKVTLVLILVVRNHDNKGCREIKTKLIELFPTYFKEIWKPTVYVINHMTAIKRKLAVEL